MRSSTDRKFPGLDPRPVDFSKKTNDISPVRSLGTIMSWVS